MDIHEALRILEQHHKWRMGAEEPMQYPALITEAEEVMLKVLRHVSFNEKDIIKLAKAEAWELGRISGVNYVQQQTGYESDLLVPDPINPFK